MSGSAKRSRCTGKTFDLDAATVLINWTVAENRPADSPVFPDTLGGLRDPSNTRQALREARGSEGFAGVTSHVFRKTVATIMDEARALPAVDHAGCLPRA